MNRRMPRPEEVSRHHIDATVMSFLKGEEDLEWAQISLLTLHPREEIRVVLRQDAERYRAINEPMFRELLARLKGQQVPLS